MVHTGGWARQRLRSSTSLLTGLQGLVPPPGGCSAMHYLPTTLCCTVPRQGRAAAQLIASHADKAVLGLNVPSDNLSPLQGHQACEAYRLQWAPVIRLYTLPGKWCGQWLLSLVSVRQGRLDMAQ